MKIKDLKGAEYNPRTITDEQLERLKKALHEFGDLSGIIKNIRTGNLVGGHQRIKIIPADAIIEITEKYKKPSRTGTTAHGFIIVDGEKYIYREVDWDEAKEKAANIAANQHGGEFDNEKLSLLLKELKETDIDIDLLGFDDDFFENKEGELLEVEEEIKAFKKVHILISFPPKKLIMIQNILEQIVEIEGVEYEQGSN